MGSVPGKPNGMKWGEGSGTGELRNPGGPPGHEPLKIYQRSSNPHKTNNAGGEGGAWRWVPARIAWAACPAVRSSYGVAPPGGV